jgi:hypothetical protein
MLEHDSLPLGLSYFRSGFFVCLQNRKAEWETRPVCGDGQRVKRIGCALEWF